MNDYKNTLWWKKHEAFVQEIKDGKIPFFKNDGKPLKEWKLFETRDAVRDAAQDADRHAAHADRHAAWYAAWYAAWDAVHDAARDADRHAAWDAAWYAAWDAVRNAAHADRHAAWYAAWDATLFTRIVHICSGLSLDVKFKVHAKARWQVWQKGYGLLCDIDGVLYVYKKP